MMIVDGAWNQNIHLKSVITESVITESVIAESVAPALSAQAWVPVQQ
jgi:hypothetical protein